MAWDPDDNDIYYRVLFRKGEYLIACLQWFDEYDYDHDEYATEERFQTEELAQAWIDSQKVWEPDATEKLILDKLPENDFTQQELFSIVRAILGEVYLQNGAVRDRRAMFPLNHYFVDDMNLFGEPSSHSVRIDGGDPFERITYRFHVPGIPREGSVLNADEAISIHVIVERKDPTEVHASTYLSRYDF